MMQIFPRYWNQIRGHKTLKLCGSFPGIIFHWLLDEMIIAPVFPFHEYELMNFNSSPCFNFTGTNPREMETNRQ